MGREEEHPRNIVTDGQLFFKKVRSMLVYILMTVGFGCVIGGPAVLTTSIVIISQYGLFATLISVLANILLAGIIFGVSSFVMKVLGESGSKALSKITSLLLAAIAVMLIRKGIIELT